MKPVYCFLLSTVMAVFSASAYASTNCDCSKLLDQCGAAISTAGDDIQIRTNTRKCSQVTWYANDEVHNSLVINGNSREKSSFTSRPTLWIGSCNICSNTHPASMKNSSTDDESAECKKRRANLKMSEKFYKAGRITPYEYQLSKDLVKKHCSE